MNVITGARLTEVVDVRLKGITRSRKQLPEIIDYLNSNSQRLLGLEGLLQTGKTTMMWQAVKYLSNKELAEKCAFITVSRDDTFDRLSRTMYTLAEQGVLYFFVDEITYLQDFISMGDLLIEYFTKNGCKVVVTGAYSLSLYLASIVSLVDKDIEGYGLWDKITLIKIGCLTYEEQYYLTGCSVTDYVRTGGLFFAESELSLEFLNTYVIKAIIENVVESIKYADTYFTCIMCTEYEPKFMRSIVASLLHLAVVDTAIEVIQSLDNEATRGISEALYVVLETYRYNEFYDFEATSYTDERYRYIRNLPGYMEVIGVSQELKTITESEVKNVLKIPCLLYAYIIALFDKLSENDDIATQYKIDRGKLVEVIECGLIKLYANQL